MGVKDAMDDMDILDDMDNHVTDKQPEYKNIFI